MGTTGDLMAVMTRASEPGDDISRRVRRERAGQFIRGVRFGLMALFGLSVTTADAGSIAVTKPKQSTPYVLAAAKTGKERLSDKASDEQRVNDCKVLESRRTKARPADCTANAGS